MKLETIATAAGLILLLGLSSAAAQEINCEKVGADVQAAARANPERVLVLVEDAILQNELCACEIVKGAIVGSKANGETVRAIVYTAVSSAQGMAATIAECAIAVAPDAADQIKLALEDALVGPSDNAGGKASVSGGKSPVGGGGKSPNYGTDKATSEAVEPIQGPGESDRGFGGLGSRGFYLTPYNAGGGRGGSPMIEINIEDPKDSQDPEERVVTREVVREVPGPPVYVPQPNPPTTVPPITNSSASLTR